MNRLNILFALFLAVFFSVLIGCNRNSDIVIDEPDITGKDSVPDDTVVVNPDTIPVKATYLTVSADGQLMRGDKPFYGYGINYFDAFYRLHLYGYYTYTNGFEVLKRNNIPFIRFTLFGYWPVDMQKYLNNKEAFYQKFDRFIEDAEKYNIGLIPSFVWNYATIPDVVGEHTDQWGNPDSKTLALMKQCTEEIVQRYKDKDIIWAWEFGNEMNIYVDPMGRTDKDISWMFVKQVSVGDGTPAVRTFADSVSTDGLRLALKEFSTVVRRYDADRAIFTGNGMPDRGVYQRYTYKKWGYGADSPAQYTRALDLQNPSYIGTISIHPYPNHENIGFFNNSFSNFDDIIRETMRSAKELKRPLYVGEFGVSADAGAGEAAIFNRFLTALQTHNVQMASLWVFDYSYQNRSWNITETNNRNYQLKAIGDANVAMKNKE